MTGEKAPKMVLTTVIKLWKLSTMARSKMLTEITTRSMSPR